MTTPLHTAAAVARATDVGYYTLLHWTRLGVIRATGSDARRPWRPKLYTSEDAVEAAIVHHLRQSGLRLPEVRRAVRVVRKVPSWSGLSGYLLGDGSPAILSDVTPFLEYRQRLTVLNLLRIRADVERRLAARRAA